MDVLREPKIRKLSADHHASKTHTIHMSISDTIHVITSTGCRIVSSLRLRCCRLLRPEN